MHKQEEKTGKTCGMEPQAARLPYVAPRIETHVVELEGGVAANSAVINGGPSQFNIDDYDDSDQNHTLSDIELL